MIRLDKYVAAIVCVVVLWIAGPVAGRLSTSDTVILDDYTHAFALCVDKQNDDLVVTQEVTLVAYRTYTVFINRGHENDQSLINLRALATVQCR